MNNKELKELHNSFKHFKCHYCANGVINVSAPELRALEDALSVLERIINDR